MSEPTMRLPFWKMSGAGNDFLIIDHRVPQIAPADMPAFARLACRRRVSVGADGLFFIEPSAKADFRWRFYNADGSEAEMCGNGARCVARFAYLHGIAAARMRFETLAGIIEATVADTQVTITMTPPHSFRLDQEVALSGHRWQVHGVDTGVPHIVIKVDDVDSVDVVSLGRTLRHHPQFAPAGTNVNFLGVSQQGLKIRTYERGVEDETLACGTGVVAAALISVCKGWSEAPVKVRTSGGEFLTVLFHGDPGGEMENVLLEGPTRLIYKGELTQEALMA